MQESRVGMEQWYGYQKMTEGRVRLLRVFGRDSQVTLPRKIAGGEVAEIGNYCFAEKERIGNYSICSERTAFPHQEDFGEFCHREGMWPLAGKNVTGITLPDSLTKIGNFAFYQCRELQEITLGMGMIEIGSDAFMNCRCLTEFIFRGNPEGSSCLKQILAQRSEETSVCFVEQGQVQAVLLYPEYSEHYDLIGPAHIFELNIQGEGFRARQCFRDGRVDFGAYDRIFALECGEESVDTLCRMACNRLLYPIQLQERERKLYEEYVLENIVIICRNLVRERNFSGIQQLFQRGILREVELQSCLDWAVALNWTEGVRQLLSLKQGERKEGTAYGFQDF